VWSTLVITDGTNSLSIISDLSDGPTMTSVDATHVRVNFEYIMDLTALNGAAIDVADMYFDGQFKLNFSPGKKRDVLASTQLASVQTQSEKFTITEETEFETDSSNVINFISMVVPSVVLLI